MASEDLVYKVGVDASDAVSGLRKLEGAVRSTMREVGDELDDSATAGDKFAASIDRLSDQMKEDFSGAAVAAEELKRALRDAGSGLEVGDALSELKRMGISFDEITADADKFAVSLKQLDDVRLQGVKDLDSVAPGLATKLDDVGKSADSSRSVLANMVGNATQDLGALSGIAGSAGVAIGQMGEYMVDAANDGDKLGDVVKNFAAVAGPIAILSLAVGAVTSVMNQQKKEAEEAAKRTEAYGEAMSGAADDAVGLTGVLKDNAEGMRDFAAASNDAAGDFGIAVDRLFEGIPGIGGLFKRESVDIIDALGDAGISVYDFAKAVEDGGRVGGEWTKQLQRAVDAGKITEDQYNALSEAAVEYGRDAEAARQVLALSNVDQAEANALLAELVAKSAPLSQMGATWKTLFDDMADGSIDTKAAADAVNELAAGLGLTQEEVINLANEHLADELDAQAKASDEAKEAATEYAEALRDEAIAVSGAKAEIHDLADSIGAIRSEAVTRIFDAFNADEVDAGKIRDVSAAIAGLPKVLKEMEGADLGDVLAGSFKADSFLDAIDGIAAQTRERMAAEFAAGNGQGAKDIAEQTIRDIVDALGGKLTGDQVSALLGFDDLEAQIDVALNESKIESVKRQLAILTGVSGVSRRSRRRSPSPSKPGRSRRRRRNSSSSPVSGRRASPSRRH